MTSINLNLATSNKASIYGLIALVTGGASGIGFSIAKVFAEAGAKVAITDIDRPRLDEAIRSLGYNTIGYHCDVSSWTSQCQAFERLRQDLGSPDIVCLNAGIDHELARSCCRTDIGKKQLDNSVRYNYLAEDFDETKQLKQPPSSIFDVNFYGVLNGIKLAHHYMQHGQGGRIIVTGSAASYVGYPSQDVYVASKHAILGLIRATSRRTEFNDKKCRISLSMVAPGLTDTPLTSALIAKEATFPVASTASDVALAVMYLATVDHEQANGRCLWIQGSRVIELERSYQEWLDETVLTIE